MVGDTNLIIMFTISYIKLCYLKERIGGLAYHNQYGWGQMKKLNR